MDDRRSDPRPVPDLLRAAAPRLDEETLDPHTDGRGLDLSALISSALEETVEDAWDPNSEETWDPASHPTVSTIPAADRQTAREALSSGHRALICGQLDHARSMFEEASALDPTNTRLPAYQARLDQETQRIARLREAEAAMVGARARAERGGNGLALVLLVVAAVMAGVSFFQLRPRHGPPDQSEAFQAVAPFTSLIRTPSGGWMATVSEPLAELQPPQRMQRCFEIGNRLPRADMPALLLRSTDGTTVGCLY